MQSSHAIPLRVYKNETVSVLLPLPLTGPYEYFVPPEMSVSAGDFVSVPLGKRDMNGVVWGDSRGQVDSNKIRKINGLLDIPPLSEDLRMLIDWTASYTLSAPGAVLRMSMSVPSALEPPRTLIGFLSAVDIDKKKNRFANQVN